MYFYVQLKEAERGNKILTFEAIEADVMCPKLHYIEFHKNGKLVKVYNRDFVVSVECSKND